MRRPIFLLAALAIMGPLPAQEKRWTLDECIAHAQEHNIEIKAQELSAEEKRLSLAESKWGYAPDISVSNSFSLSTGRVLDPTTYDFIENQTVQGNNTSISAGITLFGGMGNLYRMRRARLNLQSELLGLEKVRNDISLHVTACYLEILCAAENINNAEQIVSTLRIQEEKTAKKVEVRKVTTADLLQIQSQLSDAENEVLTARNQLYIAKLNLCHLLELDDYASFETVPPEELPLEAELPADAAEVADAALALPQVRMARLGIDMARQDIRIAQSAYYPTVSLSAAYGSSYSDARQRVFQNTDGTYRYEAYPFFEQYRDNANSYISLSLNIPIFGGFQKRKAVRRAKIASQQAVIALRTVEKQVMQEVNEAWIEMRTAHEKYRSSEKFVATAAEAVRQVERKYDLGAATVTDYNTALDNLIKAKSQFLQAKYEIIFKTRIIRFYLSGTFE